MPVLTAKHYHTGPEREGGREGKDGRREGGREREEGRKRERGEGGREREEGRKGERELLTA